MALLGHRHKFKKSGRVSAKKLRRHPSLNCQQHLSPRQLEEITQEDRMRRKAKKEGRAFIGAINRNVERSDMNKEEKEGIKAGILATLKANWKPAVVIQFKTEPDKVRNSDIHKNAVDIMSNPTIRIATKQNGITVQDIEKLLTEIRDEVRNESLS
jgi:hypothetical protein